MRSEREIKKKKRIGERERAKEGERKKPDHMTRSVSLLVIFEKEYSISEIFSTKGALLPAQRKVFLALPWRFFFSFEGGEVLMTVSFPFLVICTYILFFFFFPFLLDFEFSYFSEFNCFTIFQFVT